MVFLVLSTISSAGFSIIMGVGQRRLSNMTALGALNYLTAAAYNIVAMAATGLLANGAISALHSQSLLIGVCGGALYVTTYFILFRLMHERGVTISTAVLRLGALIPVVFSMLVYGEKTTPAQMAGGLAALASLPLLSVKPSAPRVAGRKPSVRLVVAAFAAQGACLLAPRLFNQTGIRGEDHFFLASLFATAAAGAGGVWLFQAAAARRRRPADAATVRVAAAPAVATIGLGIALGLSNTFTNQFLVMALTRVPSILAYPFYSAIGLLLTVLFARVVWAERINRVEAVGISLACGAVVLMNLK